MGLMRRVSVGVVVAIAATAASAFEGHAVTEIRISQQFGLTWLALHVMLDQKMIEKRAQELGIDDVKVSLLKFSGGPATNEALLSGVVDIAGSGGPPAIILADKTRGRQNVRAIGGVVNAPILLVTIDPRVKSIDDFTVNDRIALPAPKVSINAMILQMEAAKRASAEKLRLLESIQVGMPHPDASVALISGDKVIKNYMGIFPYVDQVLSRAKDARIILSSYDVLGGPHNLAVLSCTEKWKSENPKVFKAVTLALEDAMAFINADRRRAAEIYVKVDGVGLAVEDVVAYISHPDVIFETTPRKSMAFAKFMYEAGAISELPKSWKDLFWENVHDRDGD